MPISSGTVRFGRAPRAAKLPVRKMMLEQENMADTGVTPRPDFVGGTCDLEARAPA